MQGLEKPPERTLKAPCKGLNCNLNQGADMTFYEWEKGADLTKEIYHEPRPDNWDVVHSHKRDP